MGQTERVVRMRLLIALFLFGAFAPASLTLGQQDVGAVVDEPRYVAWIFDAVTDALRKGTTGGATVLDSLIEEHRPAALRASSASEECVAVHALLAGIPSSHVALFSRAAYGFFDRELRGVESLTVGLFLRERSGALYVDDLMVGGPADRAGLKRGDRIVAIDGVAAKRSPRLDLRNDDAYLPDSASHLVLVEVEVPIDLDVRRGEESRKFRVSPEEYSSLQGDHASARVIESGGNSLGYVRLSYMYGRHTSKLMRPLLQERFRECDGLVLDLRGRGGSQIAMWALMAMFQSKQQAPIWSRPVVLLVDRNTRSAKEVFADWFQKAKLGKVVGETTVGAARGGRWSPIGDEYMLLCPREPFAPARGLELSGLTPDVLVDDSWPAASDSILARGLVVLSNSITDASKASQ